MLTDQITIRPTTAADMSAVDALLAASYPSLLKPDYPPSVLVTALPLISRANPGLLRSGTYFVAMDGTGRALAAGGWSHAAPQGGVGPRDLGHIRHVATHPSVVRKGLATAVMHQALAQAFAAGIRRLLCQSTRTAVPFYEKLGFRARAEIEIALRPGITFPAVEMIRSL
ncbi:GNAT family N-acetyltransferase [Rhodobacterales bacterium HKCCE3408]|nr:GNAT family N-acetyltransferase [Rhodobacterales bacterium HKCCE3408]